MVFIGVVNGLALLKMEFFMSLFVLKTQYLAMFLLTSPVYVK